MGLFEVLKQNKRQNESKEDRPLTELENNIENIKEELLIILTDDEYYPAMADVVRFKLPNSNETFTPNGDVVNENQGSESDSMTLASNLNINTELEQLTFDHRKEIYDRLTGMERLVNSAEITLTENELKNEQNANSEINAILWNRKKNATTNFGTNYEKEVLPFEIK